MYSRAEAIVRGNIQVAADGVEVFSGKLVMPGGCDWYILSPSGLFTSDVPQLGHLQDQRYLSHVQDVPSEVLVSWQ